MTTATTERPAALQDEHTRIGAKRLDRLLANGVVFSGNDLTLPVLTAVQLVRAGSTITAYSTDRYALIRERIAVEEESAAEEWTFLLSREDVLTLRQLIACATRGWIKSVQDSVTVGVTVSGDVMTVVVGSLRGQFSPVDGKFPQVEAILGNEPAADASMSNFTVNINTALFARLHRIDGSGEPWHLSQPRDKQLIFARPTSADRDTVVAFMPMRVSA